MKVFRNFLFLPFIGIHNILTMVMVQVHKVMMTIMAKVSIFYKLEQESENLQTEMIFKETKTGSLEKISCVVINLSFVNREWMVSRRKLLW